MTPQQQIIQCAMVVVLFLWMITVEVRFNGITEIFKDMLAFLKELINKK